MNTLSYIVATDNAISAVLHSGSGYQVQQLFDLYRTSPDKEEFVHVLCTRLLMESKRPSGRALHTHTEHNPTQAPQVPQPAQQAGTELLGSSGAQTLEPASKLQGNTGEPSARWSVMVDA